MNQPDLKNHEATRLLRITQLLQQIEALNPQQALFPDPNQSIDEIVQSLEKITPISQPLQPDCLPYLVGEWDLIYASQGTIVTRQVASLFPWRDTIKIDRVWQQLTIDDHHQIQAINAAILNIPVLGKWQLQAHGIWSWQTAEQVAQVSFSSFSMQAKQPLSWSSWSSPALTSPILEWMRSQAIWITSYLDAEIRVGRGATGNLFVFRRKI